MVKKKTWLLMLLIAMMITACSKDDDFGTLPDEQLRQARVTLLATHNGMGDNGYIDSAIEGIFAFVIKTGTPLQLLLPHNEREAEQMYNQWIADNATRDSSVLIVGTEAYETFVEQTPVQLKGKGTRVLLFESKITEQPDGVSAIMLSRYGAAYLAGAMSKDFNALIIAATPGYGTLEDAINGFMDGHNAHHAEGKQVELCYLSDNESGFAIPDSAYRMMSSRIAQSYVYRDMVFPLLGGSGIGVLRCMNDEEANLGLIIGMDVDQSAFCSRVPFSMIVRTGDVLHRYLDEWLQGVDWPKSKTLGMKDGGADIMLHPLFYTDNVPVDDRYRDPDTFVNLYNEFKEEAIRKEEAYEK